MITRKIKDWKNITDMIEISGNLKYANQFNYVQFRGQSNSKWKLDSSLKRVVMGDDVSEKKADYYEVQVRTEYMAQSHLIGETLAFKDDMDPQAMFIDMQHFSCPTRVLDWSTSPYVALYFAVSENIFEDGAMFIWNQGVYMGLMKQKYPHVMEIKPQDVSDFTEFNFAQLVFPTRKNERIVRQQGTFTISNNILLSYCDIMNEPLAWSEFSGLQKLIIPSTMKMEILARLRTMNISASSLFPGMDGLGRSIKEGLLIRKWNKK